MKLADAFPLNPGSIVAMDRGYNDYALFARWTERKICFVTRLKDNAAYEVLAEQPVPENRNILSGELIQFSGIVPFRCGAWLLGIPWASGKSYY